MSSEIRNALTNITETVVRNSLYLAIGTVAIYTAGYYIQKTMKVTTDRKRERETVAREAFAREFIPEPSPIIVMLDDLNIIYAIETATDLAALKKYDSRVAKDGWQASLPLPPKAEGQTELGFEG